MGCDKKKECVCRLEDSSRRHGCQAPFAMMQKISVDASILEQCVEENRGFQALVRAVEVGMSVRCVLPFFGMHTNYM